MWKEENTDSIEHKSYLGIVEEIEVETLRPQPVHKTKEYNQITQQQSHRRIQDQKELHNPAK